MPGLRAVHEIGVRDELFHKLVHGVYDSELAIQETDIVNQALRNVARTNPEECGQSNKHDISLGGFCVSRQKEAPSSKKQC